MARLSEVKQSADDIGQTAEETLESTREELRKLREKLRRNGAQLEDELRDAGERFAEGARTFGNATAEQVRAHVLRLRRRCVVGIPANVQVVAVLGKLAALHDAAEVCRAGVPTIRCPVVRAAASASAW